MIKCVHRHTAGPLLLYIIENMVGGLCTGTD
jgi:hypothetical protein